MLHTKSSHVVLVGESADRERDGRLVESIPVHS